MEEQGRGICNGKWTLGVFSGLTSRGPKVSFSVRVAVEARRTLVKEVVLKGANNEEKSYIPGRTD